MLRVLVVVLALATLAMASDDDDCCSAEDRKEVAFLWNHIWHGTYTDRKVQLSRAIFEIIFEKHPESQKLFAAVKGDKKETRDSPEFRSHLVRIATGIDQIVNMLEDPFALGAQLDHLAAKHGQIAGLHKSYFATMIYAFDEILPQVSSCFNVEAWNRCFSRLVDEIDDSVPE